MLTLFRMCAMCTVFCICAVAEAGQIALEAPASSVGISGRVVDTAGAPLVGVTVVLRLSGNPPKETSIETDKNGGFGFSAFRRAEYEVYLKVRPSAQGFGTAIGIASMAVAQGRVKMGDIVLDGLPKRPAAHLAGQIQVERIGDTAGARGRPMPIAAIYAVCTDGGGDDCPNFPVHIVLGDGMTIESSSDKDKMGDTSVREDSLAISDDDQVAGWLTDYPFCCTSYPIALKLTIFRPDKPIRNFDGDGLAIFNWHFLEGGKQVDFYQDTLHGEPNQHYELRDVDTGRLVDQWNGQTTPKSPAWVRPLAAESGSE